MGDQTKAFRHEYDKTLYEKYITFICGYGANNALKRLIDVYVCISKINVPESRTETEIRMTHDVT